MFGRNPYQRMCYDPRELVHRIYIMLGENLALDCSMATRIRGKHRLFSER
jgi:hypothetical protein